MKELRCDKNQLCEICKNLQFNSHVTHQKSV